METARDLHVMTLTAGDLLGRPLNDVEEKFAPTKLYVAGTVRIPLPRPRVSIVGSRKASPDGLESSAMIAGMLARKEVVIVSGLADGIDTSAHNATLEAEGKTIAVIGTPLNKVYPQKILSFNAS